MKDILGDQWTTGLGLHMLSRNGGIQTLLENNGGMGHLTTAAGLKPSTADEYATEFNDKRMKAGNGNGGFVSTLRKYWRGAEREI